MNQDRPAETFSAFLPLSLLAASLMLMFIWNLVMAVVQHSGGVRIRDQQQTQLAEAAQAEAKVRLMMTDLLELAKKEPDAEALVSKYRISITQPAPAPVPAAVTNPPALPPPAPKKK